MERPTARHFNFGSDVLNLLHGYRLMGHSLNSVVRKYADIQNGSDIDDGRDIMEFLHIGPGPDVGYLMGVAREAQANGEIETKDEALEMVRDHLQSGGRGA